MRPYFHQYAMWNSMTFDAETIKEWLRKDPRIALGISALLLLFILLSVISTTRSFFTATTNTAPERQSITMPISATNVANFHLFGLFQPTPTNLPQTNLQLSLEGIALSSAKNQSSIAIISSPSGQTKIYRVGDAVPGGATIAKMQANEIVLNDNGRLEVLKLPVPKLNKPQNTLGMY